MPAGAQEGVAAVVARDVRNAELAGFRIVGDAATPLGTGILVERSHVTIVDVEVVGASGRALEFGAGAEGSFIGGDVHDNPGAGLVIRSGASPRISHSGFARNGVSERVSAPVVVEAGAPPGSSERLRGRRARRVSFADRRRRGACGRTGFPASTRPGRLAPAAADGSRDDAKRLQPARSVRHQPGNRPWRHGRGVPGHRHRAPTAGSRCAPCRTYSGQDVLEAEHRGAELQKQFCQVSAFVPEVYDHGSEAGYFYVAMEYLEGENLSQVIRRGPLPAARAVAIAIELCRFLEDARGFAWNEGGRDFRHLLHGDLTPVNVRIMADDRVKVLDFGIAKALSMSRKVTRNDFGNLAYLSPERIESGGEMDATDGFWAARRDALRDAARRAAVQRARHAAARARDRRAAAGAAARRRLPGRACRRSWPSCSGPRRPIAIRAPRRSGTISSAAQAGDDTEAQKEGWPGRAADEPATRRIGAAADPRASRGGDAAHRAAAVAGDAVRPAAWRHDRAVSVPRRRGGRAAGGGAGAPRGRRPPVHAAYRRPLTLPPLPVRAAAARARRRGPIGPPIGGLLRVQPAGAHRRSRRSGAPRRQRDLGRPRRGPRRQHGAVAEISAAARRSVGGLSAALGSQRRPGDVAARVDAQAADARR